MHKPACESAIAPIIAEILMVALICLAAAIAYVFVFQIPSIEKIPMVAADITKNGNLVSLFFKNGDPLEKGRFYVTVNGDRVPDGNISLVGGAYPWSPGERIVANYSGTSAITDVKLVYLGKPASVVLASAYFPASSVNTTPVNNTPIYSRYPGFTVEAWVKWNADPNPGADTTSRWATVVVDGTTDNNRRYQLQHDQTNAHFEFALATATMSGSGSYLISSTTPVSGTWYHVTGVYNKTPGTMAISVNGVQQTAKSVGLPNEGLRASPGKYQVGGPAGINWPNPPPAIQNRKLNGDLRGVKTYEEALSQAEILAHYQSGVP
jgi:hypothetical protein